MPVTLRGQKTVYKYETICALKFRRAMKLFQLRIHTKRILDYDNQKVLFLGGNQSKRCCEKSPLDF